MNIPIDNDPIDDAINDPGNEDPGSVWPMEPVPGRAPNPDRQEPNRHPPIDEDEPIHEQDDAE
ncbi:hypothetical protein [Pseudomonas turukhanskensis]|uniref:hypothetical protein n=1 Tax=Pseudomonas turukhanskensis TaxID=1806536 RepID=UPI0022F2B2BD|nr:hypothetical protein [Pseudomonas turukhanskensis]